MNYEDLYAKNRSGKMYWQHLDEIVKNGDKIKIGAKSITITYDLQWRNLMGHFERKGSIAAFKNLNNLNKIKLGANSYKLTQIWNNLDAHQIDFLSTASPSQKTPKIRNSIIANVAKASKITGVNKDDAQESLTAYWVKYMFENNVSSFKSVDYSKLGAVSMQKPPLEGQVMDYKTIRSLGSAGNPDFLEGGSWDESCFKQVKALKSKLKTLSAFEMAIDNNEIKNLGKKLHNELVDSGFRHKNGSLLPKIADGNKFSTADIYIFAKQQDFNSVMKSKDVFELVNHLQKLHKDKKLIGVSLKKILGPISTAAVKEVNVVKFNYSTGRYRIGQNYDRFTGITGTGKGSGIDNNSTVSGKIFFSNAEFNLEFNRTKLLQFQGLESPSNGSIGIKFTGRTTTSGVAINRGAQIGTVSGSSVDKLIDAYNSSNSSSRKFILEDTAALTRACNKFKSDHSAKIISNKTAFELYQYLGGKALKTEKEFIDDYNNSSSKVKASNIAIMIYSYRFLEDKNRSSKFLRYLYNYLQASHDYGGAPYIKLY